jgi:hypothetical protein
MPETLCESGKRRIEALLESYFPSGTFPDFYRKDLIDRILIEMLSFTMEYVAVLHRLVESKFCSSCGKITPHNRNGLCMACFVRTYRIDMDISKRTLSSPSDTKLQEAALNVIQTVYTYQVDKGEVFSFIEKAIHNLETALQNSKR